MYKMRLPIFTTGFASFALALVMGQARAESPVLGHTYAIAEPDAISEIEERASKIDWEAKARQIDVRAKMRAGSVQIPPATKARTYPLDLTYTLPFDIPDGKGGVLYPKGYRFNPVAFVKMPYKLGVIGTRPEELAWARKQQGTIIWMTSGGDPFDLTEKLEAPVYLYTPEVAERMPVQGTPALIVQKGQQLVVSEYFVESTR